MTSSARQLLIAHVVYRFDVGGLENGVVNLINRLPSDQFRHAVVALTEVTDFRHRINTDNVQYVSLFKPPGQGLRELPALYRIFRKMRPDVVHTRNLAPLEASLPAWLAGVPARIHGEHGWDVADLQGANRSHRWIRRAYRPFVTHYVALSRHIETYLREAIGVAPDRVSQIYNGVDTQRFRRRDFARGSSPDTPFGEKHIWLVGTVGRLVAVKNQVALIRAVAMATRSSSNAREHMRLVIVGDGPLRGALSEVARAEGISDLVWFAGERNDVSQVLSLFDAFALPSLAEGISNTVLEAMATQLPVVATRVGGNSELIDDAASGTLVAANDPAPMADAIVRYFVQPDLASAHAAAARRKVEARFSLDRMVAEYAALYSRVAARAPRRMTGSLHPIGD